MRDWRVVGWNQRLSSRLFLVTTPPPPFGGLPPLTQGRLGTVFTFHQMCSREFTTEVSGARKSLSPHPVWPATFAPSSLGVIPLIGEMPAKQTKGCPPAEQGRRVDARLEGCRLKPVAFISLFPCNNPSVSACGFDTSPYTGEAGICANQRLPPGGKLSNAVRLMRGGLAVRTGHPCDSLAAVL